MKAQGKSPSGKLTLNAVAGTYVVLLGFNVDPELRKGLMGFSVCRIDPTPENPKGEEVWLCGRLNHPAGSEVTPESAPTNVSPIQKFRWADYTAHPGHAYTYRCVALYGTLGDLTSGEVAEVQVTTEDPNHVGPNGHQVHFNRSAASSQAFVREFPDVPATADETTLPDAAKAWLSRGLAEGLIAFIDQAQKGDALHLCVYEFQKDDFLQAIRRALDRGVQIQITYDAILNFAPKKPTKDAPDAGEVEEGAEEASAPPLTALPRPTATIAVPSPTDPKDLSADWKTKYAVDKDGTPKEAGPRKKNEAAMRRNNLPFGPTEVCRGRNGIPSISHNKFMVYSKPDAPGGEPKPVAVWTGSTNFTDGAVYGQANVGHAVWNADLAAQYLQLHTWIWNNLDKGETPTRNNAEQLSPFPIETRTGSWLFPVFSPRHNIDAITQCVKRIAASSSLVCLTAPFPLHADLRKALEDPAQPGLKYALLNSDNNLVVAVHPKPGQPPAADGTIPANLHFAGAARFDETNLDAIQKTILQGETQDEELVGFKTESLHHKGVYIHTKIIVIDPLSDNPILVTGSANFSSNSSMQNDENQKFIFGEKEVAHVYLTEFMRLYDHYAFRDYLAHPEAFNPAHTTGADNLPHLSPDDTWTNAFFDGGDREKERIAFGS